MFHNLFISVRCSACFGQFFHPSSGVQNCTYNVRYLTLYVQFWTPDDGQKNCPKHAEHLTVINKLWNIASCWLYSENILAMHGPMNVKHFYILYFENYFCVNSYKQNDSAKLFLIDKLCSLIKINSNNAKRCVGLQIYTIMRVTFEFCFKIHVSVYVLASPYWHTKQYKFYVMFHKNFTSENSYMYTWSV